MNLFRSAVKNNQKSTMFYQHSTEQMQNSDCYNCTAVEEIADKETRETLSSTSFFFCTPIKDGKFLKKS